MDYEGQYIRQPRADIRPKPLKSFRGRTYAASVSEETGAILAKLGVGMLIIAQKPWEQMLSELESYRTLYRDANGEEAPPPVLHTQVVCHEDADRAEELAHDYIAGYFHTVVKQLRSRVGPLRDGARVRGLQGDEGRAPERRPRRHGQLLQGPPGFGARPSSASTKRSR